MCMSGPSAPAAAARLPQAARTPDSGRSMNRAGRRGAGSNTVLTSSRGVTNGNSSTAKTLLGQ